MQPDEATQAQTGPPPKPQLSLTDASDPSPPPSDLRPRTSDLSLLTSWPLLGPIARFAIPYRYTRAQLAIALAVILTAKLFHEYTLHVGQWFESFTPTEAIEAIYRFLTPPY